jgi:hypothetical protein
MAERSPEDVLAGVLRFTFGGVEKVVPTLKIREVRDWQRRVTAEVPWLESAIHEDGAIDHLGDFVDESLDKLIAFVIAYDVSGALGGREWLEANADPSELYEASRAMGAVSFPFVGGLRGLRLLLASVVAQAAAEASSSPSSTNGASPTGDSMPEPSKSASTRTS